MRRAGRCSCPSIREHRIADRIHTIVSERFPRIAAMVCEIVERQPIPRRGFGKGSWNHFVWAGFAETRFPVSATPDHTNKDTTRQSTTHSRCGERWFTPLAHRAPCVGELLDQHAHATRLNFPNCFVRLSDLP